MHHCKPKLSSKLYIQQSQSVSNHPSNKSKMSIHVYVFMKRSSTSKLWWRRTKEAMGLSWMITKLWGERRELKRLFLKTEGNGDVYYVKTVSDGLKNNFFAMLIWSKCISIMLVLDIVSRAILIANNEWNVLTNTLPKVSSSNGIYLTKFSRLKWRKSVEDFHIHYHVRA